MKATVFFNNAGQAEHCVSAGPDPATGRHKTLCGKLAPVWFRASARHVVNTEKLFLVCPVCALELAAILRPSDFKKEKKRGRDHTIDGATAGHNGQAEQDRSGDATGGCQATPGVRTGGSEGGPAADTGSPVDPRRRDPVASSGGAESTPPVGAKARPQRQKKGQSGG
jgi:hypothetical protein